MNKQKPKHSSLNKNLYYWVNFVSLCVLNTLHLKQKNHTFIGFAGFKEKTLAIIF